MSELTKEQWKKIRDVLKEGLLSGGIPVDSTVMKPKQVWQEYKEETEVGWVDYGLLQSRDKFTRMLRSLQAKHKDGDLQNEGQPKTIEWGKSAAKQMLKRIFREGKIDPNNISADRVWDSHCKGQPAFARMKCDDTFARRLKTVRDDYMKKVDRRDKDLLAFQRAKQNHPTPALNSRGEPQWNGSEAQRLLKALVATGGHEGIAPKQLWQSSEEYQKYSLTSFRDHIYQEERLLKFRNYLEMLREKKRQGLQY